MILLLQTNTAKNGKCVKANVLCGAGSTISSITFELARRLNLKGKREKLQVIKMGGDVEKLDTYRYNVDLISQDDNLYKLEVLGLAKISSVILKINMNPILQQLKQVQANEVKRQEDGQIEVLIGFDQALLHPVRIKAVDELLLSENQLGKVVGGVKRGICGGHLKDDELCSYFQLGE